MPSMGDVTITLPFAESAFLRAFLEGIMDEMKSAATAKEWESPELQAAAKSVNNLIQQLPKENDL